MRYLILVGVLMLAGCGPALVVLRDPHTGTMAQCQGDPWGWNPYAATEACAKGYEAAGYMRMGEK